MRRWSATNMPVERKTFDCKFRAALGWEGPTLLAHLLLK
jgi:hypothetical protein